MRQHLRIGISLALLVGTLLILQVRSRGEAVPARKALESFPNAVEQWQGRGDIVIGTDVLALLKPKDYLIRRFQDSKGRDLWLFIAYWDTQRKGAQPHSPKNCLPGAGWEPLEASRLNVPLPAPLAPIIVNRYLLQKDDAQQLVLYWYQAQGKPVAGEVAAKVEMIRNSILHRRTDGALVRISGPIYGNAQQTTEHMVKYIQALYPALQGYLPD